MDRLYNKAVPKWERDASRSPVEKIKEIRAAFDRAQVAEPILRQNLPNLFSQEKAASWRREGRAIQLMQDMVKQASQRFEPDLTPGQVFDQWYCFELPLTKRAQFDPDLKPEDLKEAYNSIYGNTGPRLASMREWPKHWLDDQDSQGWLQWYEKYDAGRRSDTDDKQIARWKGFKARHGAQFVTKPTPRRAFALMNWGIDPIKMLPMEKGEEMKTEMEKYRRGEYVRWFMSRHDFDDDQASKLADKARKRGAKIEKDVPGPGELMTLALDGFIEPEDLKP